MIERHGADFTRWRRPRVILLTPNELEPYHIYDRHPEPLKQLLRGGSAQQLADATAMIYFPVHPPGQTAPTTATAESPVRRQAEQP